MTGFEDWLAHQAEQREDAGLTRRLVARHPSEPVIDLAGNDYLGLARHPRVVEGAVAAAQEYGAGAGASRLVTGTLPLHEELEQALAAFTGFPEALVFSTGYHANLSAVSALTDPDTLVVSDAHVHASMIDACRLSRASVVVVPHNDVAAVDEALAARTQLRAVVLVETIYSVLGDAAPVRELAEVCAARDAVLIADEAHALGVAGIEGRGLLRDADLGDAPHVVGTLTLSKSLGAQGGAVLASSAVREHLVNRARPFIYDTGLAPAAAGGALAALRVVEDEPQRVARVNEVAGVLARACRVEQPAGAVLAVPMPGPLEAVAAVEKAAGNGVRIGCFRPPSTPDGISRLRLTAHAQLDDDELARAAGVLDGLLVTIVAVTGTDTEIGKTVVTAALAAVQLSLGRRVAVVKPAQTGIGEDDDGDLVEVRRLAGEVSLHEGVRLPDPLAPDAAARVSGIALPSLAEQQELVDRWRTDTT